MLVVHHFRMPERSCYADVFSDGWYDGEPCSQRDALSMFSKPLTQTNTLIAIRAFWRKHSNFPQGFELRFHVDHAFPHGGVLRNERSLREVPVINND